MSSQSAPGAHIQAKQPFEIPDRSVKDPQGKLFGGRRARVFWLLHLAAKHGTRFDVGHGRRSDAGWVPLWAVREPWSGGTQGDRRLRELRTAHGYQIHKRIVQGTGTTVYRIDAPAWLYKRSAPSSRRRATSAEVKRHRRPLHGVLVRIVTAPGAEADEIPLEEGHPAWPAQGRHQAEAWTQQMREAWRRKEFSSWLGRRVLVFVLRTEDARTLLFDFQSAFAQVLSTLGADVVLPHSESTARLEKQRPP